MSIATMRQEMNIPGIERLTMRYEDGGKIEVYSIGEIEVRVKPGANAEEVRAALEEAMK